MPMMHILLLLVTQTTPADHVLDRYVSLRKSLPQMEIAFTAATSEGSIAFQSVLDGKKRLYVTAKAPGLDYIASITPKKVVELDIATRTYDESVGYPQVNFPKSRLTSALDLFPTWLYVNDLREMAPKAAPFIISGSESLGGQKCDRVVCKYKQPGGVSGTIDASIDSTGLIRRVRILRVSPMGSTDFEWHPTSMKPMTSADALKFDPELPLGYVPYGLPDAGFPLEVGAQFPLNGWSSGHGKLDIGQKLGANGGLIAIVGEPGQPGGNARTSLSRLAKDLPVVVLADSRSSIQGTDGYDATGQTLSAINPPSTPFFALVDAKGMIRRLWMGYVSNKAGDFEADVKKSFNEKE